MVKGITNPTAAKTTNSFYVASYALNGTDYILIENGGSGMTVTPTPGSITSNSLTLTNPTVGIMTILTL